MANSGCAADDDLRLDAAERQRTMALVERVGETRAAERFGVSRSSLVRGLAGRPLRRGTLTLMRLALVGIG